MIYLGFNNAEKTTLIRGYCTEHNIRNIFILSPEHFMLEMKQDNAEEVTYSNIIKYVYYYRLLQEIGTDTLVVINECLRTQNRYDLTYNCIRNYLNQTRHQLVFQYLPVIESIQDFMILFDFDTQSRFKREQFAPELLSHTQIIKKNPGISLEAIPVATSHKTKVEYQKQKHKLFAEIGHKDPHTLPRTLYLISGKSKLPHINPIKHYVGRNNRFKLANMVTYKAATYEHRYTVFELPHNFIDFTDFLALSRQSVIDVLVADLKADQWYFERYSQWLKNLNDVYSAISK